MPDGHPVAGRKPIEKVNKAKKRIKRIMVSLLNRSHQLDGNKEPNEPSVKVLPVQRLSMGHALAEPPPVHQVVKVTGSLTISF